MSQTIIIQEDDTTLKIATVVSPSRDPLQTSKIKLPVGGAPLVFCDENNTTLLTLDSSGNLVSAKGFFELSGQAAPALSAAGKTRLYFDSTANQLLISEDGGAYVSIVGMASVPDPLVVGTVQTSKIKLPVGGGALSFTDESNTTLLTLDSSGNIASAKGFFELSEQAAPGLSGAGKTRLYFDSTAKQLFISEDGGAYVSIVGMALVPDPLELGEYRVKPGATVVMSLFEDDTFASGKPLFTTDSGGFFFDADDSRNGIIELQSRLIKFHGSSGVDTGRIQDSDSTFTVQSAPGAEMLFNSKESDGASSIGFRFFVENAFVTAGAKIITVENGSTLKRYTDKDGVFHFPFTGNPNQQGMFFSAGGVDDQQFIGRIGNVITCKATNGFQVQTATGSNGTIFAGTFYNNTFRPPLSGGTMMFHPGTAGAPGTETIIVNFASGSGAIPTIDRYSLRVRSSGIELSFSDFSDVGNQLNDSFLVRLIANYWNGSSATNRKFELIHEMLSTAPSSRLNFDLDGTTVAEVWDDGSVRLNTNGGSKPSAAVAHRGKLFVEQGGAGVTDRYFVCLKSAADSYSWVEVVNGG